MTVMNELNAQAVEVATRVQTIPTAVLERAHLGDIHGALGSIAEDDFVRRSTLGARLKILLAILGPGLIVMVGDNDAGAFAQTILLWLACSTIWPRCCASLGRPRRLWACWSHRPASTLPRCPKWV
jgi:hypothetical protein